MVEPSDATPEERAAGAPQPPPPWPASAHGWPGAPGPWGPPWPHPPFTPPGAHRHGLPTNPDEAVRRLRRYRRRGPIAIFLRFAFTFGFLGLAIWGVVALVIYVISQLRALFHGGDAANFPYFILPFLLIPWLAGWMGRRAFRGIAQPIADVMAAADTVAQGDLSARVPVRGRADFAQLAQSFNHMVDQLQQEDQRRRNLTADVAHELRTPLQIIQGNLEGVLDGVYAPSSAHLAATLEETRQLARLVEDLRVLSQAEAGQLPMQREQVNVAELVGDVATSFSGAAQEANIGFEINLPPNGQPLLTTGDYGRLDQVLSNLVANALRHTPAAGRVTLTAYRAGDEVAIAVSDTGEGIPASALPYIFDRFYRADPARTRSTGGSGLGLAIARELVQAHGGRIEVRSAPGQGSTFTVLLPQGFQPPPAPE